MTSEINILFEKILEMKNRYDRDDPESELDEQIQVGEEIDAMVAKIMFRTGWYEGKLEDIVNYIDQETNAEFRVFLKHTKALITGELNKVDYPIQCKLIINKDADRNEITDNDDGALAWFVNEAKMGVVEP